MEWDIAQKGRYTENTGREEGLNLDEQTEGKRDKRKCYRKKLNLLGR